MKNFILASLPPAHFVWVAVFLSKHKVFPEKLQVQRVCFTTYQERAVEKTDFVKHILTFRWRESHKKRMASTVDTKKGNRKRDRIGLFGNTIRLSADFLIALADTIRMLADRIKISTTRNRLFFPSKRLKQSFFSMFRHTKEA